MIMTENKICPQTTKIASTNLNEVTINELMYRCQRTRLCSMGFERPSLSRSYGSWI